MPELVRVDEVQVAWPADRCLKSARSLAWRARLGSPQGTRRTAAVSPRLRTVRRRRDSTRFLPTCAGATSDLAIVVEDEPPHRQPVLISTRAFRSRDGGSSCGDALPDKISNCRGPLERGFAGDARGCAPRSGTSSCRPIRRTLVRESRMAMRIGYVRVRRLCARPDRCPGPTSGELRRPRKPRCSGRLTGVHLRSKENEPIRVTLDEGQGQRP